MYFVPFGFFQQTTQNASIAITGSPWQSMNTIVSYLRNYVTDFRNPQFFLYRLDGTAYTITDGGQDMFDTGGNSTAPWLRAGTNYTNPGSTTISIPPALPYSSQSATLTDTNYYYASFGYTQSAGVFPAAQSAIYHPLTMFGARSGSGPIGFTDNTVTPDSLKAATRSLMKPVEPTRFAFIIHSPGIAAAASAFLPSR